MLRLFLLLILIALLVRFLVRLVAVTAAALRDGSSALPPSPTLPLVPCKRCGVFVPRELASAAPGDGFLCRSCAAA